MMDVAVRAAAPEDIDAFVDLLAEMKHFYGAQDLGPVDQSRLSIDEALFSDAPSAFALLAWRGPTPVGLATYSYHWPALGLTRSLYLKELYVSAPARRLGAGRALMRALFEVASRQGCSRVEWTTDVPNTDAQDFYKRLGALPDQSKVLYRVYLDDPTPT